MLVQTDTSLSFRYSKSFSNFHPTNTPTRNISIPIMSTKNIMAYSSSTISCTPFVQVANRSPKVFCGKIIMKTKRMKRASWNWQSISTMPITPIHVVISFRRSNIYFMCVPVLFFIWQGVPWEHTLPGVFILALFSNVS